MYCTPLLRKLLVMDNDITNVEEGAFTGLEHLTEINLRGENTSLNRIFFVMLIWMSAIKKNLETDLMHIP